jgi:hypothetical protein
MLPQLEYQTYHPVFAYLKKYPNFSRLIKYDYPILIKTKGFEEQNKKTNKKSGSPNPIAFVESIRRTKTVISDLTLCNDFDMFVTFTFAKDRQNINKLKKQMSQWLKNEKARRGKFSYIIVPEFHKDGVSIHFHALFKNYKGDLINSGKKINQRTAFNLKSYTLGYSTAVKIDDISKVSSYVRKYITKDMPKFEGKKRYWCSTGLKRPIVVENPTIDPWTMSQFVEKCKIKYLTVYELDSIIPDVITISEGTKLWQHHKFKQLTI